MNSEYQENQQLDLGNGQTDCNGVELIDESNQKSSSTLPISEQVVNKEAASVDDKDNSEQNKQSLSDHNLKDIVVEQKDKDLEGKDVTNSLDLLSNLSSRKDFLDSNLQIQENCQNEDFKTDNNTSDEVDIIDVFDTQVTDTATNKEDAITEEEKMGACLPKKQKKHVADSGDASNNENFESNKEKKNRSGQKEKRNRRGDRDTEIYRSGYSEQEDDETKNKNLDFYRNKIRSQPDGDFIERIHKNWKKNYKLLERHHGYIQWLFPIREHGMNWEAQPLQLHEAEAIKSDPQAKGRVVDSYKLMLDFYGMELKDEEKGTLERAQNYKERFKNLTRNNHNYLRITRILKSLGELGYEHFKKPFLDFVLNESLNGEQLLYDTLSSCENYWIGTIKDDDDREQLYKRIEDNQESD